MSSDGNKSLTFSNKWKYDPGKKLALPVLNLEDIRRQLQDSSSEESDASESEENPEPHSDEKPKEILTCAKFPEDLNKSFCDDQTLKVKEEQLNIDIANILSIENISKGNTSSSSINNIFPDTATLESNVNANVNESVNDYVERRASPDALKNNTVQSYLTKINNSNNIGISRHYLETMCQNQSSEKPISLLKSTDQIDGVEQLYTNNTTVILDKENISNNIIQSSEPLNLSREKVACNNSFDLDFSALSLHTPIKKVQKNINYTTPKINIIPPTETKQKMTALFKTPNVANKQPGFSKPLFKTPMNKPQPNVIFSANKKQYGTPYCLSRTAFKHEYKMASDEIESYNAKPVVYIGEDGFNRITVNDTEYIVMHLLGKGGSSEVFSGFHREDKLYVAIKLVSLSDPTSAEGYIKEVKLLQLLQKCDRIIKMYDYEIRDENLIIVLEKSGEDLSTILKSLALKETHLPTHMLLFYWMEMLYAVKQIHDNGVIHSDLKPANFLRNEGGLKLIDFGIASKVQEDMTCVFKTNQEGSCNYISPEALNSHTTENVNSPNFGKTKYKIHFKSDVWSLGCILYQLVYRKTPFHHINQLMVKLAKITDPNHQISYPEATWVSPKIVNTIKKCLQYDTKLRPTVDELIEEYEQMLHDI